VAGFFMRGRMASMSDFRKQLATILHHTALKVANSNPSTLISFYMAPGALGLMVAKSRAFGITEDFALSLALASFVYMSMPALWFLMVNLATGGTRFRLQMLLIVFAIIVIALGLAYWLAAFVTLKN
jgi:hypothetical protein